MRTFLGVFLFALIAPLGLAAQNLAGLRGQVIDAATKEGLPFATVAVPNSSIGFATDVNGFFQIKEAVKSTQLKVSSIGYEPRTVDVPKKQTEPFRVELAAISGMTEEVVIRPKKYRNKNNPAVALIENVIRNRKTNRVEGFESFEEEQYEKVFLGISNLSEKFKNRKMIRSLRVMTNNVDTTLLKGQGITPVYLQEAAQKFYSQRKPKRSKIWVSGEKKGRFPFLDEEGVERYI